MIKRTLYFGNPAYLSMRYGQMIVKKPGEEEISSDSQQETKTRSVPIEDVGIVVLDNKQITLTQGLLEMLLDNNCAVITCDSKHMPVGLMLPLSGHTIQNERKQFKPKSGIRQQSLNLLMVFLHPICLPGLMR